MLDGLDGLGNSLHAAIEVRKVLRGGLRTAAMIVLLLTAILIAGLLVLGR